MKIGFVFTNFNSSSYTKDLVISLRQFNSQNNYPIIIVDNDSNEENIALLKLIEKENNNVHLILSGINLGYFKGLNVGIKYIRENLIGVDYLVVGNNDLIFPRDFVESISKTKEIFEKYPVISPNIITTDGVHQNPHVIKNISKFREFIYDLYFLNYYVAILIKGIAKVTKRFSNRRDREQHEIAQSIYSGYGACYILSPLFFDFFDSLWAPTFLMGEEFFLSKQLESENFKVYYEPSIFVEHQLHSTMNLVPSKKVWDIAKKSHKEYRKYVTILK
jgi:GT2 family glycosyltransferase